MLVSSSLSHRLPQKRVLTLNLELPESWLVEPVMALHDLDNLRLADIQEQVSLSFDSSHSQLGMPAYRYRPESPAQYRVCDACFYPQEAQGASKQPVCKQIAATKI